MAELVGEEEKNERARQRKKEKKHRSKLQKLADAEGCSIEDLEVRWKQREEQKKIDDLKKEQAAIEAERQAELAVQREKQERIAEIQRQRDALEAEAEEEREEERRIQRAEQAKIRAAKAEKNLKLQEQQ